MRKQSFHDWLFLEAASSRMALISIYEKKDRLLYVDAPALRQRYLSIFGNEENLVLQSELEASLLRRKIELIQTAINRRESVDLEQIDEQIEKEKEQKLSELEQSDTTLNELPQLSEDDMCTLKKLYHEITEAYHPAVNPNLSETQRELYQKAVEAYKMQDVDAMRTIHEGLFVPDTGDHVPTSCLHQKTPEELREDYREYAAFLTSDYSLAKKLYPLFAPLEEDMIVTRSINEYEARRKEAEREIADIMEAFPFNAVATMNDPAKIEEYRAELRIRARRAESEKTELGVRIEELLKGRVNG